MVKLLAFSGSLRSSSFNKKLVRVAAEAAKGAGVEVTLIDLKDFPLPLYDGDLEAEEGLPENAKKIKKLMKEHDGFLISSPEYNSGMSGVLKNVIDWASRPEDDEPSLVCFRGKVVGIMSTSPGGLGGLRGLYHLRWVLQNIHCVVLTNQVALGKAHEMFDGKDKLKDTKIKEKVESLAKEVVAAVKQLKK